MISRVVTLALLGGWRFRKCWAVIPSLAVQQSINFILDFHTISVIWLKNLKIRVQKVSNSNSSIRHLFFLKKKRSYKSSGLVGSDTVEDHFKCTGEKSTLPWRPRHCERLPAASYPIGKEQTCNNHRDNSTAKTSAWTFKNHFITMFKGKKPPKIHSY